MRHRKPADVREAYEWLFKNAKPLCQRWLEPRMATEAV